eukprot:74278-Prorocentrum_minimum.AAC.4
MLLGCVISETVRPSCDGKERFMPRKLPREFEVQNPDVTPGTQLCKTYFVPCGCLWLPVAACGCLWLPVASNTGKVLLTKPSQTRARRLTSQKFDN